jgi:hypothetical protein
MHSSSWPPIVRAQGARRGTLSALLGVLVLAMLAWAPAATAAPMRCLIINNALNASYSSLQAAQDAATAGDTLWVRGRCFGTTTITKDLTLTGQQPRGFTSPALDGASQNFVLTTSAGVAVTINTLTITDGNNPAFGGGGIDNLGGTVTLNDSTITGDSATYGRGGGISNDGGLVTLNGSSSVSGNYAANGGGIYNSGTVSLNNSSSVSGNSAIFGGGIFNSGTVNLNNSSSVSGNSADLEGGGIFVYPGGTVNLNGGTVTGNTPDDIVYA